MRTIRDCLTHAVLAACIGLGAISSLEEALAGCAGLIVGAGSFITAGGSGCADPPVCSFSNSAYQVHYLCISDANFDAQAASYGAYNVIGGSYVRGTGTSAAVAQCPPNSFPVVTGATR